MKRALAILMVLVLTISLFAGCANRDTAEIKTAADLANKRIGVQEGTTGDEYVTDKIEGAKVSRYKKVTDIAMDLKNGKIDAIVLDKMPAQKVVEKNSDLKILDEPLTDEAYAIAVRKGDTELLNSINQTLKKIQEDGTYDKLIAKFINGGDVDAWGNVYEIDEAVDMGIVPPISKFKLIKPLFTCDEYIKSIETNEIKQALFDWFCEKTGYKFSDIDKFYFEQFGSFDDGKVLVFNPYHEDFLSADVITYHRVGNRILIFTSSDTLMAVFSGQNVYDLETAYELGLLNDERLDSMAEPAKFIKTYKLGDLDWDGEVTISDLVCLRRAIMNGNINPVNISTDYFYDINSDGQITVSDIVCLRSIIMNK